MTGELDYTFRAMGSDVRLLIGERLLRRSPPPLEAADRERAFVLGLQRPAVAVSPRQRSVGAQPRPAHRACRLRRCCVPRSAPGSGRPSAAAGWSTRRSSARSSGPATTTRSTASSPPRSRRRSRTRAAETAARPDPAAPLAAGGGRRPGRHDHPSARPDDRHRWDRQGAVRRRGGAPAGGLHPVRRRLRRRHRGRRGRRTAHAIRDRRRASADRRVDRLDQGGSRRHRHVGSQRPHLAPGRRRPTPTICSIRAPDRRCGAG